MLDCIIYIVHNLIYITLWLSPIDHELSIMPRNYVSPVTVSHVMLIFHCHDEARLADPTDLGNTAVERLIDNIGVSYEFSCTYLVKEERTVMDKMAQWVKAPASKSDDLSSVPGICMVEEDSSLLQTVFTSANCLQISVQYMLRPVHVCTHMHTHTHTQQTNT